MPGEPAVSIMAMSLDSHIVDHGSSPGPSGLNSCQVHVHACPRSGEENGGEGTAAFSLSVFLENACPYSKKSQRKKYNFKWDISFKIFPLKTPSV